MYLCGLWPPEPHRECLDPSAHGMTLKKWKEPPKEEEELGLPWWLSG